jgi:predicted nucleic acid-binding protein
MEEDLMRDNSYDRPSRQHPDTGAGRVVEKRKAIARCATRSFLSSFDIIALDGEIAERAVNLRREHHIKSPDAIIWATAQTRAMLLVTRNVRDFAADDPGIRMPYKL